MLQFGRRVHNECQRIAQDTLASVLGTKVPYARPAHDDAAQALPELDDLSSLSLTLSEEKLASAPRIEKGLLG